MKLNYETFETKLGPMIVIAKDDHIIRLDFGDLKAVLEKADRWFKQYFGEVTFIHENKVTKEVRKQITEYFAEKRKHFTVPYDLFGTPFQQAVWEAIEQKVSYGETCSYKNVGEYINNEKAVRAIGGALNKNPISIIIPCHRVISSTGSLTGYGGGLDKKAFLLELEHLS